MTVQQALLERSELEVRTFVIISFDVNSNNKWRSSLLQWTEEVCTCDLDDPLSSVLDIIIKTDVSTAQ